MHLAVLLIYCGGGLWAAGGLVAAKKPIPIGAIIDEDNADLEVAFHSAIYRENMYNANIEFVPIVIKVPVADTFVVEKKVCGLLSEGVAAIFGPSHPHANGIISSICNTFQIPHFVTNWQPEDLRAGGPPTDPDELHAYTRNFFPASNVYSRVLAEVIVEFEWKTFTVLYEHPDALMRMQDVLQIHGPGDNPVTVRQIGEGPDYRPLLKEVYGFGETRIIIDCEDSALVMELLRQGRDVKMLEEYQHYLITTRDAHALDFAELKFVAANITTIRLMDPGSFEVATAVHDWNESVQRQGGNPATYAVEQVATEPALLYDAVKVLTAVIKELDADEQTPIDPVTLKCNANHPAAWEQGATIMRAMSERTEHGMSGRIVFDDFGQRTHFYMEVLELSADGFKKIAVWDPQNGVTPTRDISEVYSMISQSLHNKTLIVSSRIGKPFLRHKEPVDGEVLTGNDRYEGYSMDLIDAISKILGFSYRFELTPDNRYGSFNKVTKKWDGLVKQLLDRKADIAICDLTITYERRTAVDFTMPFMTLGISILFAKPQKSPPELFSFLYPLSLDVWIYTGSAYLGVSLLLFILARAAPDDWESSHPCDQDPEELENIWEVNNCFWLTVGSIMGQGCDLLPKAISTRLATGMWWFFALIMLASYTANLAAFLTKEQMDVTIDGAEDLAKQSKIKYGAVLGGSTLGFFKSSNFSLYQRMWSAMESAEPSVFVTSNQEGEERVAKSKRQYAFFMESLSLEYITERNCNLTQIGGLLDSKGYGIAMAVNSPYRTHISQAVLKLQEEGKLFRLKNKWWKELDGGGTCTGDEGPAADAAELGIANVGGVFVILLLGCLCATVLGIVEFLWNIKAIAIDQKCTPWEALKAELLFAADVRITTKPVNIAASSEGSSGGASDARSGKGSAGSRSSRGSGKSHPADETCSRCSSSRSSLNERDGKLKVKSASFSLRSLRSVMDGGEKIKA